MECPAAPGIVRILRIVQARGPLDEHLISLKEAAAHSGLSHSHLRLLARTGKIAARRLGRDWFTTEQAVAAYLENQHSQTKHASGEMVEGDNR